MIVVDVNVLAEDLKTTLVTADQQILAEFPGLTMSLKAFAGDTRPPGDA